MDKRHGKFYSTKPESYLQFSTMMSTEYLGDAIFPEAEGLACLECGSGRADFSSNLPFARNTFDIVFCVVLLELFEDVQSVVNEMVRVLKPGGIFFACIAPGRH